MRDEVVCAFINANFGRAKARWQSKHNRKPQLTAQQMAINHRKKINVQINSNLDQIKLAITLFCVLQTRWLLVLLVIGLKLLLLETGNELIINLLAILPQEKIYFFLLT